MGQSFLSEVLCRYHTVQTRGVRLDRSEVLALVEVVALWVSFFAALTMSTALFSLSLLLDSAFDAAAAV